MGKRKKQPPPKPRGMSTRLQDGRGSPVLCPSPASTPELFGETSDIPSDTPSDLDSYKLISRASGCGATVDTSEPTLSEVLATIKVNHTIMVGKVEELKMDFAILRQDVHKIRERVGETERRISSLEDTITPLTPKMASYSSKLQVIEDKADDLENRLRRNNLRLIGLPEKVEGSDPAAFLESWMTQEFGKDCFSQCFVIERAHRVPGRPLPPGYPPRPMVIRLLNYRDRDAALRAARAKDCIRINNATVSLFPDYSTNVRKLRAQFQFAKQKLREAAVSYAMFFPARLRVTYQGQAHFFTTPESVLAWLESTLRSPRSSTSLPPD